MKRWYYEFLEYTTQVVDYLNKLSENGVQSEDIKVDDLTVYYFWNEQI